MGTCLEEKWMANMGKIATLIQYCSRCDSYFSPEMGLGKRTGFGVRHCPNCGDELTPVAAVNAYELKQLIAKLSTPEGIVNLLENLRNWIEGD